MGSSPALAAFQKVFHTLVLFIEKFSDRKIFDFLTVLNLLSIFES